MVDNIVPAEYFLTLATTCAYKKLVVVNNWLFTMLDCFCYRIQVILSVVYKQTWTHWRTLYQLWVQRCLLQTKVSSKMLLNMQLIWQPWPGKGKGKGVLIQLRLLNTHWSKNSTLFFLFAVKSSSSHIQPCTTIAHFHFGSTSEGQTVMSSSFPSACLTTLLRTGHVQWMLLKHSKK